MQLVLLSLDASLAQAPAPPVSMRIRPALERLTGPALRAQPRAAGHRSVLLWFLKMAHLHFRSQMGSPQCMLRCGEGVEDPSKNLAPPFGVSQAMVVQVDMVLAT